MAQQPRYSPEVRERAVHMVFEHEREYASQWETIRSIVGKIGCTAETLRRWVRTTEIDSGQRWSPSFGQPDSGVKVDTMRFDRLLSLCSLWGWFPLRRPLNMSGGTGFSYG